MNILILGAGAWGSTLAYVFSQSGKNVTLWSHNPNKLDAIDSNSFYIKDHKISFNQNLKTEKNLVRGIINNQIIIFCSTSQTLRSLSNSVNECFKAEKLNVSEYYLISGVKGLELSSFLTMSQILNEVFNIENASVISGPNLALEILSNLPCASVIACKDDEKLNILQHNLTCRNLRLYANNDIIGVEIGAAYKNVIAIACGICDGLNLGYNAKASLLTRGIKEMARVVELFGGQKQTVYGLSGLGDLIATSSAPLSRNYSLGYYLANDMPIAQVEKKLDAQIEGIPTSYAIMEYTRLNNIDLPITTQVYNVLSKTQQPREAIKVLMSRPLSKE